jgi:DNA-directed RNA polymerase specialized sigma24 family protein
MIRQSSCWSPTPGPGTSRPGTLWSSGTPLLWSICCRYGLGSADAGDASQNVWLALVDQLDNIRDPAALPGWLATTTRRECNRVLRARSAPAAVAVVGGENIPDEQTEVAEQRLLTAERHAALREAFTDLPQPASG